MAKDLIHYEELLNYKTPNTFGENYSNVPKKSGVYFFALQLYDYGIIPKDYLKIIYVGSSKNLYNRYSSHEIRNKIRFGLQFYFIEIDNYYDLEKKLIKFISPKFNKQHNKNKIHGKR